MHTLVTETRSILSHRGNHLSLRLEAYMANEVRSIHRNYKHTDVFPVEIPAMSVKVIIPSTREW